MRNIASYFVLSLITVIGLCAHVSAQGRNSISGFVFDMSRVPVPHVYVELQSENYTTVGRVRTDGAGLFRFGGLASGHYNLKVLPHGTNFDEQSQRVSLMPISALPGSGSISEQIDFYLRPKRSNSNEQMSAPGVIFAQDVPKESGNLYKLALDDLAAKNDVAGFEKLKKAIEIFPDYYLALDRLGNEYVNRGFYEAAYVLLARSVNVNKRSVSSSLGLGLALFRLGQFDQALQNFQTVVSLDASSPNGHLWLGIALNEKKRHADALRSLLKANELSSGNVAEVHWQLARVYKDLNRFDKSADELELFLKYSPGAKNTAEIKQIIDSLRKKS